jgi:uncharacterized protein YjbI with pentapeptide repeats
MKIWEINHISGDLLYSGQAKSFGSFVEGLVRAGTKFRGADLRGNKGRLNDLNLDGADFQGAFLDGAVFDGSRLRGARFDGASMREWEFAPPSGGMARRFRTKFRYVKANDAVFDCADMTGCDMRGTKATRAKFREAILDRVNFSEASITSANFFLAKGRSILFTSGSFTNSDFACVEFIGCDFCGGKFDHWAFGRLASEHKSVLYKHLPDRTRGATIIGGIYDEHTILSDTVPLLESDRRRSRRLTRFLWTLTTVISAYAIEKTIERLGEVVEPHMGRLGEAIQTHFGNAGHVVSGIGLVALVSVVVLVKEGGIDIIRDRAEDFLSDIVKTARSAISDAIRIGRNKFDLVCAMGRKGSLEPLRLALAARMPDAAKRGFWSAFSSFFHDTGDFIICDRRHLALAMSTLAAHGEHGFQMLGDITLLRHGPTVREDQKKNVVLPQLITFLMDGRMSMTWSSPQGNITTSYRRNGDLEGCWSASGSSISIENTGLPPEAAQRELAVSVFERSALSDHGLHGFTYPKITHELSHGRDQSILVYKRSDRRLDNPYQGQPAIIKVDDGVIQVRNGSLSNYIYDSLPASKAGTPAQVFGEEEGDDTSEPAFTM